MLPDWMPAWLEQERLARNGDFRFAFGHATIGKNGRLRDLRVVCSEPAGVDVSWFKAMTSHWRFAPAVKLHKPISSENNLLTILLSPPRMDPDSCLPLLPPGAPPSVAFERYPPYADPLPNYPEDARAQGKEGRVVLSVNVRSNGTVADATVACAAPKGVFDAASLEAVRTWRYPPLIVNGQAVENPEQYVAFEFRLR